MDFDKTAKTLIDLKLHTMLINELFDQTDDSFATSGNERDVVLAK